MLLHTENIIAIRCPDCDKLNVGAFSLFSLKQQPFQMQCECGTELLILETRDCRNFSIYFLCSLCEDQHLSFLRREQVLGAEAEPVYCEEIGVAAGYVGPEPEVLSVMEEQHKSIEEMAEELAYGDYFINPPVMYRILKHIYNLAENGMLSCSCGSRSIEIEIFPDNLELKCENCSSGKTIMGQTETDLKILRIEQMEIVPSKLYTLNFDQYHSPQK